MPTSNTLNVASTVNTDNVATGRKAAHQLKEERLKQRQGKYKLFVCFLLVFVGGLPLQRVSGLGVQTIMWIVTRAVPCLLCHEMALEKNLLHTFPLSPSSLSSFTLFSAHLLL